MRLRIFGVFTRSKFHFFAKIRVRVFPASENRANFRSVVSAGFDSRTPFISAGNENVLVLGVSVTLEVSQISFVLHAIFVSSDFGVFTASGRGSIEIFSTFFSITA